MERITLIAVVETGTAHVWDLCAGYTAANNAAATLAGILGVPFHTRPASNTEAVTRFSYR